MPTPFGTLVHLERHARPRHRHRQMDRRPVLHDDAHRTISRTAACCIRRCRSRSYTKVTRADSDAIFAFMQSVPPVKQQNRPHDLKFPYNNRSLIIGWRTLFFTEGEYKPDPTKSDEWNRGAYLVAGPRPLRHVPHRDQRARRQFGIGGLRGRPDSDAELVRAVADLQQGRRASATGASRTFPICFGPAFPTAAPSTARWRTSPTTACNT